MCQKICRHFPSSLTEWACPRDMIRSSRNTSAPPPCRFIVSPQMVFRYSLNPHHLPSFLHACPGVVWIMHLVTVRWTMKWKCSAVSSCQATALCRPGWWRRWQLNFAWEERRVMQFFLRYRFNFSWWRYLNFIPEDDFQKLVCRSVCLIRFPVWRGVLSCSQHTEE